MDSYIALSDCLSLVGLRHSEFRHENMSGDSCIVEKVATDCLKTLVAQDGLAKRHEHGQQQERGHRRGLLNRRPTVCTIVACDEHVEQNNPDVREHEFKVGWDKERPENSQSNRKAHHV